METFTRMGELKERIDYTFDNQPNPLADLYFFSLDPDYTGQATNLIENQGPYGIFRREYRLEYDDQHRVGVMYRREKPTDSWIAEYRFIYGQ